LREALERLFREGEVVLCYVDRLRSFGSDVAWNVFLE
jgi:hypothetical protein